VRWGKRLAQLEGSVSRVTGGEPEEYCRKCLGPGGYRLLVDRAWARIAAAEERGETREVRLARYREQEAAQDGEPPPCFGCGGLTMRGAIRAVRRERGLDEPRAA
jgi:hypothetical protein